MKCNFLKKIQKVRYVYRIVFCVFFHRVIKISIFIHTLINIDWHSLFGKCGNFLLVRVRSFLEIVEVTVDKSSDLIVLLGVQTGRHLGQYRLTRTAHDGQIGSHSNLRVQGVVVKTLPQFIVLNRADMYMTYKYVHNIQICT